jgi:hypothetical protein
MPLSTKDYADLAKDVLLAIVGPGAGYLAARSRAHKHQNEREKLWDEGAELSHKNEAAVRLHDTTLAEHALLHKGYAGQFIRFEQIMSSTRDCVNRIAGKVGADGTS